MKPIDALHIGCSFSPSCTCFCCSQRSAPAMAGVAGRSWSPRVPRRLPSRRQILLSASRAVPTYLKGPDMQHVALAILLIGAAVLGGCSDGVLDPKGPIASAERLIMLNSTGIMLAIVIPTMIATLGTAFWFRASNNRARYLPDFDYSGRLELLVWSIPIMTVLLVGGVSWISSYDLDPPKGIASAVKPVRVQVVSLDWKWL